jgi:hypothetical protein
MDCRVTEVCLVRGRHLMRRPQFHRTALVDIAVERAHRVLNDPRLQIGASASPHLRPDSASGHTSIALSAVRMAQHRQMCPKRRGADKTAKFLRWFCDTRQMSCSPPLRGHERPIRSCGPRPLPPRFTPRICSRCPNAARARSRVKENVPRT